MGSRTADTGRLLLLLPRGNVHFDLEAANAKAPSFKVPSKFVQVGRNEVAGRFGPGPHPSSEPGSRER